VNDALRTTRLIALALVLGPLVFWIVAHFIRIGSGGDYLVMPAVLFGLVSPVIGYRIYLKVRERRPSGSDEAKDAFLRANILALAITEAAALFGCVAYLISYNPLTYIGYLMHVLLAGAIWPNEFRLQQFLEGGS
jgi:hypothetical protein